MGRIEMGDDEVVGSWEIQVGVRRDEGGTREAGRESCMYHYCKQVHTSFPHLPSSPICFVLNDQFTIS